MYKVVYNACYGGFGLSVEASQYLKDKYGVGINPAFGYLPDDVARHDKRLVEVVERFGDEASGMCSKLKIATISSPMYRIDEYDGFESVETPDSYDWVSIA